MKKRFLVLMMALVAVCLLALTPQKAEAATIVKSGTCGNNLTWTLDSEGTLYISGEMEDYGPPLPGDFIPPAAPWAFDAPLIKHVIIEQGVTKIGEYAFFVCYNLTSITIPDSVTSIDAYAFDGCSGLTDVHYLGCLNDWKKINIRPDNDSLIEANLTTTHKYVGGDCNTPGTCAACGAKSEEVMHAWINATCTVPKHCTSCGLTEGTASHVYTDDADALCDVCGEIRMMYDTNLTFYGNPGMSLKDYIGMQILMKNSVTTGYDKVYAIAVQKTPTGDITTTINQTPYTSQYSYFEQKILARSMCDEVTLTLYGEKNGVVYQGASVTTSVLQLSMEKLATYKAQNDTAKCKMIVDMLNFGAAVQTTFNVNVHQLPNANLGEYAVYGSTHEPTIEATNSITGTATVKVGQHNISMQDRVEIQLLFTKDISEYRTVATMSGVDVEVNIDTETFKAYGYTVVRVPIAPANFRETYTIALFDVFGDPVTQIYNVSVEGYANARKDDASKHPLDVAFMRYSDSAAAVFRNN